MSMKIIKVFRLKLTSEQERKVTEQLKGVDHQSIYSIAQIVPSLGVLDVAVITRRDKSARAFKSAWIRAASEQKLTPNDRIEV